MKKETLAVLLGLFLSTICIADEQKQQLGGDTTVFNRSLDAFAKPLANLPTNKLRDFTFGNRLFNTNWIIAPASVTSFDGLGPTFNRVSCSGCHFKDGRGRPPENTGDIMNSMLIRLSVAGSDPHGGPKPHPHYGGQLNDKAIANVPAEGQAIIHYDHVQGQFADGTPYELTQPHYEFKNLAFGALDNTLFSPRVAPAVYGLGLLEAVPEETILSFADPDDSDQDGISGRPNWVWDAIAAQKALGRFGWKANQPSLKQQSAGAALGDIGITTSLNPTENCPAIQKKCQNAANGGNPELSDDFLAKLVFYVQTLAVPARRHVEDPQALSGEQIFHDIGCNGCHKSQMTTSMNAEIPELANQTIHPYTDLLLHDMGEALADHRPDYEANGREWRTPPLWGIGLVETVNGHTRFLHDGRARNIEEAILWHGGEAKAANDQYQALTKTDRDALLRFLETL